VIEDPAFSQRAFAAGRLTGIRSFKVTERGILTGVWHAHDFTPGENLARCCIRHSGIFSMTVCHRADAEPVNHRPGSLRCSCGFYAYFDGGSNPHHRIGHVLALIDGWGVMSVGARGFRCEKARLVAFIDEAAEPTVPVAAARWAFARAARVLRLGQPAWPATTIPTAVRRAYPAVPIFRGVAAALAAHPLAPPERPREAAA
jgi:hypothetical protein